MRAAVLRRFGDPLDAAELPEPEPGVDEVLIRVAATGLCGTDLKVRSGALPSVRLPLVPGHEVAGEVVHDPGGQLSDGQHVACYMYESCGVCSLCLAGRPTLCSCLIRIGIERHGGLAEYMAVTRENALPLAPNVSFEVAAVSMDSVLTPWHGLVNRAAIQPNETVMVIGTGGLGLNGVQIARHLGAKVAAVDPHEDHRRRAVELGAELSVLPSDVDIVRDWAGTGVDVALDTSGAALGFEGAFAALRPGGRLVACGYQPGIRYQFESSRLPLEEITILGARVGTRSDAQAALDAVARGSITPYVSEMVDLGGVNLALERLAQGDVVGRIAVDPSC